MKKETVLIAAYGTLRSGECNERFCRNAISRRIATISGTLYDTGWGFPAFVPAGKTKVTVELIEHYRDFIPRILRCSRLEMVGERISQMLDFHF